MRSRTLCALLPWLLLLPLATVPLGASDPVSSQFDVALHRASAALEKGELDVARLQIDRALERDPKSPEAWSMRARWAEAAGDTDELVYALHKEYRLRVGQDEARGALASLRAKLEQADPFAEKLLDFRQRYVERLLPLAEQYEKEGRPHSAIRVHQEILSLDPERIESEQKIEEISSAPDPTLAATAKPKDLLEGVSEEWIRRHDRRHGTWENRARLEKPNYVTETDAGYEVLVRAGEAMEQMNAFYREWFQYGTPRHPGSVTRITLRIFKNRDEYLEYGSSPAEWSGGQFTGSAVETFTGGGGFSGMVGTLFHEAAHQFVSLATTATGWLNEGIASFFEGTRILANGTVQMNLPANHRLFPLAARMENGWMTSATDGIDPNNAAGSSPRKAPTFQIIIENEYDWGPPWYAPTWGFVYFLYNYQDPVDGRFVYRKAFQEFVNSSGGRVGKSAIENFEKIVVRNPARPTPGVDFSQSPERIRLPRDTDDLNEVWKEYILDLRDIQTGRKEVRPPYHDWARYALTRKEHEIAKEHFEKGILQEPRNIDMLSEFAALLADRFGNRDRAAKLALQAIQVLEMEDEPDQKRIDELERSLVKWDPKRRDANRIREDLRRETVELAEGYYDAELYLMAMDVSLRFAGEFRFTELFDTFEKSARKSQKSLALWKLAYNEVDLSGWNSAGNDVFQPYGNVLRSSFGEPEEGKYDFRFLTMETVTSGDFSMEAELFTEYGKNTFAGLVFGFKDINAFHALFFMPGGTAEQTGEFDQKGFVDLTTFYGPSTFNVWRHNPVEALEPAWHELRIDVTGSLVDIWFDDMFIATQDFKNLDVLRGSFGLITGPGQAKFRNVRYLAREARDPAAWIERQLRLEKYSTPGAATGGSDVGRVPPFPTVAHWVQGERTSWREKGPVPTLMVFFSPEQNELVRLDEWLNHVANQYADVGLEIISICAPDDGNGVVTRGRLEAYLAEHPWPGVVGLDSVDPRKGGFGDTLDEYGVGKYFYLPRLVLLDLDGKVVWEGDPGFELRKPWAGEESYLATPLKELVENRMLRKAATWIEQWNATRDAALQSGDIGELVPLLAEAANLPADYFPEVAEATRMLDSIQAAIQDVEGTLAAIEAAECEPAMETLMDWAEKLETPIDTREHPRARAATRSANAKAWDRVLDYARRAADKADAGREEVQVKVMLAKLEPITGGLPTRLREEIQAAYDARDIEGAIELIRDAETLPSRWLLEGLLGL